MKLRLLAVLVTSLLLLLPGLAIADTPCNQDAGNAAPHGTSSTADAFTTAYNYLVTFYPRWFTYNQSGEGPCNKLVGPDKISPIYQAVVAINDDTLYASAFVGARQEPVIVTVPATTDNYSVLQLDQYGNVFAGIPNNQPGVYGLTGPDWQGSLPNGVTQVPVPYNYTELIFRADKYVNGVNMEQEANTFRKNLHAAYLSDYLNDANSGQAQILPEAAFAVPYKTIAVDRIASDPVKFLQELQTAVLSPGTQPLSADEQTLSDDFNALFADQNNWPQMGAAAQAAHATVEGNYLTHTFTNTVWVNFINIGAWDTTPSGYLDRSSLTDYIQYGNNYAAAIYYQAFHDSNGDALDGTSRAYYIKFGKGEQPQVKRFWSVTAYLPKSIELVPNDANKYVVASYTPGLVTAQDGSVTILMSPTLPQNFPAANWLPIPKGQFNVMLRAYGPVGGLTYVPPPVVAIWNNNQ